MAVKEKDMNLITGLAMGLILGAALFGPSLFF